MVISIFCRIDEYLGAKDWQEVVEKVTEVFYINGEVDVKLLFNFYE